MLGTDKYVDTVLRKLVFRSLERRRVFETAVSLRAS